ncbi:putative phage integrase, BppC protein (plasmid) [Borreliella bissettiae DN127]|uniref:Phage integrase, BppC protein n=1 Tax=Borrelia bissettiae (strain DSM 17990 / CIP 109136 / DN127) TaxID=521010 RepID=G0ANR3_BORBD|nr:putative phage integrase, BppC protein [Borreliella bissettiae DN127]
MTPKIIKLILNCAKTLKQIDPISGWFLHILAISGCRGAEIQKVKMQDITPLLNKTGETFYNIKVNIAKKRNVACIREIVISSKEFQAIQTAHKNHFEEKLLIQDVSIFFKRANINLKIIKLILSIFLENLKIFLKNPDFAPINRSIYLEICLFHI